jgi:glutaredoxin 3
MRINHLAIFAFLFSTATVEGFAPSNQQQQQSKSSRRTSRILCGKQSDNDDPTKVWYAQISNDIQKILTSNSPLNEGKKALVRKLAGDYDREATRAKLNAYIDNSQKSVLMLSFTTWPFCVKAKQLLDEKGVTYTAVELDVAEDGKAIRAEMGDVIGRTSVPAIWIDGVFIGGCNDGPEGYGGLITMENNGTLDGLLKSAGVL